MFYQVQVLKNNFLASCIKKQHENPPKYKKYKRGIDQYNKTC